MELLVKYGALIDGKDGRSQTPLRNAAYFGKLAAVKWLVSHGADIKIKDNCKQPKTARQVAQQQKHAEVVAYLKELETAAKDSGAKQFGSKRSVGSSSKTSGKSGGKSGGKRKRAEAPESATLGEVERSEEEEKGEQSDHSDVCRWSDGRCANCGWEDCVCD